MEIIISLIIGWVIIGAFSFISQLTQEVKEELDRSFACIMALTIGGLMVLACGPLSFIIFDNKPRRQRPNLNDHIYAQSRTRTKKKDKVEIKPTVSFKTWRQQHK